MTGESGAEFCPMPTSAQAPDDATLALILARATNVAIVGASPTPTRTSYAVTTWLMSHTHYSLYLVNPVAAQAAADIEGHGFYASLAELPVRPDIVVAFRKSEDIPPVAEGAIASDAAVLWMQLGITHEQAAETAKVAGLEVIQNRCIKVEFARLASQIKQHLTV